LQDAYRRDARFHPAERMRQKRERQSKPAEGRGEKQWSTSASKR
jgi:hypothetical protein